MAKRISNQGNPRKASQRLAWLAFSATWETACSPLVWVALTAVWTVAPVLSRIKPEPNWGRNGNRKLSKIQHHVKYLTLTEILVLRAATRRHKNRTKIEVEKLVKRKDIRNCFMDTTSSYSFWFSKLRSSSSSFSEKELDEKRVLTNPPIECPL